MAGEAVAMRILLVEDNTEIANAVRSMLERDRYAVTLVADGDSALEHLSGMGYDAAILDVVLPKRDGFEICRAARACGVQTPVLMLTARDAVEDRVKGLDCGADDYLVKPFIYEELAARLRAIVRRAERPLVESFSAAGVTVDPRARTAAVGGQALDLGTTQFRLLEFFVRNAGITFTRAQLLERIWDYNFDGSSNIVDVYVSQLRRKLRGAGAPDAIETVWGVGYKFTQ